MSDLTVGQVSGLIAAGVFALHLLLPLVFPAILAGFINEKNTVVTWSVLSRFLHSSLWPTILQTDAAARHGVQSRVNVAMWLQTGSVALVSLAAIFTPLGLYQTVEPAKGQHPETFQFVQDNSAFGYGTPLRTLSPFTRSCGSEVCPGSSMNQTCVQQGLLQNCSNTVYDRDIPNVLTSLFKEGASLFSKPVSSIFDIQWRAQINATDNNGGLGWYMKSAYRQVSILILDESLQVVDGLIVDARNGGIGFRNHTVPLPTHEYGSTWTEDILFVEPETQCVDLNVTFDFQLTQNDTSRLKVMDMALVDHGGFSDLSRTSPDLTTSANGQGDIDLRERAYTAAWLNNFLTLAYFNATDPDPTNITRLDVTPGMEFKSDPSIENGTFVIEYQSLRSSLYFGEYLVLPTTPPTGNASNATGNPFGISSRQFSAVSDICAGGSISSPANINSSMVGCGLIYGAARRRDGGSPLNADPKSKWSVPVYSCAASIRATIRTVTFQYNGTGLEALKVAETKPKVYSSDSELPLWAVENMHDTRISDAQPLWGVIGRSNATVDESLATNVSTISQASLRLPGILDSYSPLLLGTDYTPDNLGQNIPGVDFYTQALLNAFSITRPGQLGNQGFGDYSGRTGLALYSKWQQLSSSAKDASSIINLVWTDIAANSVVGTKGWGLGSSAGSLSRKRDTDEEDLVAVTIYHRRVRYRIPYAVPAFIALAVTVVVVVAWIVLLIVGKTGPTRLRDLLDATSAGRVMGFFLWPGRAAVRGTDEWVKAVGTQIVVASNEAIVATGCEVEEGGRNSTEKPGVVDDKGAVRERHSLLRVAEEGSLDIDRTPGGELK